MMSINFISKSIINRNHIRPRIYFVKLSLEVMSNYKRIPSKTDTFTVHIILYKLYKNCNVNS